MAKKTSVGTALGFVNLVTTGLMAGVKNRDEIDEIVALPESTTKPLIEKFVRSLRMAAQVARNIFRIDARGSRTTEQVVAAGNYSWSNPNINSQLFPMRRCAGKRDIVLVPMPANFTLEEALAKLTELNLGRPTYEDGLFFGEQYPEKQRENPIMFPHEPVVVDGVPGVVYLWDDDGDRELVLSWADDGWDSIVLVAGVRKS